MDYAEIYEEARNKRLKAHADKKPWHADETREQLLAVGIIAENLIEYLDWLRETPR